MKSYFFVTLLALVLLTALLAGGLSYLVGEQQPVVMGEPDIDAVDRVFYVGASGIEQYQRLLTPGIASPCNFNVTSVDSNKQVIASDMDLSIIVDMSAALQTLPGLSVRLVEYLADGTMQELNAEARLYQGVLTYVRPKAFAAARPETRAFGAILTLRSDDAPQLARATSIKVQVTGTNSSSGIVTVVK